MKHSMVAKWMTVSVVFEMSMMLTGCGASIREVPAPAGSALPSPSCVVAAPSPSCEPPSSTPAPTPETITVVTLPDPGEAEREAIRQKELAELRGEIERLTREVRENPATPITLLVDLKKREVRMLEDVASLTDPAHQVDK